MADAKAAGMLGVAVMTRKGPWLAGSELFEANRFELVASAPPDYELWVREFKARSANPSFKADCGATAAGMKDTLTIVRAAQCPYVAKFAGEIAQAAEQEYGIVPKIIELKSYRDAQNAPTPYAVFSIVSKGRVLADHPVSCTRFRNIMRTTQAKAHKNAGVWL